VGYRGVPVPGLPFDERNGVIPNRAGRVLDGDVTLPGYYVAGWIKRGPSGVIGTNKPDGAETAASLLADVPVLTPSPEPSVEPVVALLRSRGVRPVSFDDWHVIDRAEQERGKAKGKPREKFTRIEEMLALLD
jgi:ferredoxin/flavodoxin---NADP+ reductase